MLTIRGRVYETLFLLCLCLSLFSCGGISPRRIVFDSDTALTSPEKTLKALLSQNEDVRTIKGIGRAILTKDKETYSFRTAWIGMAPDRIRIEVRTLTGQTLIKFASDGERIYLLDSEGHFYRKKATGNSLRRIISIKMSTEDFLDLVSGRIPVHLDGNVRIQPGTGDGDLITIDGKGRGITERIGLDQSGKQASSFERLDGQGQLIFRVSFDGALDVDGKQLPRTLVIENGEGDALDIRVDRYVVNPEIEVGKFVLEQP